MRALGFAIVAISLCVAPRAGAGEFNKTLRIGDAAPAWVDVVGPDGQTPTLADVSADVVVIAFTCVSCPVALDYEDRLLALAKKYEGRVAVVAINPNTGADDSPAKTADRAKKKMYPFPYFADPTGRTAKAYGAMYTPEFFVLNKARKIVYMGAFDDKNKAADAKVGYVAAALDATLASQPVPTAETLARGCKIKFAKGK
jgi:peroxiredoxin